jgi:hypothetical protein
LIDLLKNEQSIDDKISMRGFCERYRLPRSTVRDWKDHIENDKYLHSSGGRPSSVDKDGLEEVYNQLKKRRIEKTPADENTTCNIIRQAVQHTNERENRLSEDPSLKTIKRIKKKVGAQKRKAQVLSNARKVACSDVRMSYSVWIMIKALTEDIPPHLHWNWDATQFVVGQSDKSKKVYTVRLEDKAENKQPLSILGEESLDIGIKWMHMGSAAGAAIPIVFLVAVDSLKADDFRVYTIPGLSVTVSANAVGYLCVCSSRAGNAAFFSWFIQNVAITTVEECRTLYMAQLNAVEPENAQAAPAFISSDGEAIVMDEVFDQSTRSLLEAKNIQLGKIAASCSGIHQPSDVSPLFRASKTRLRSMLSGNSVIPNPSVEAQITRALNQLETDFGVIVPSGQKSKVAYGCIASLAAIQDVIRPRLIQAGFAECGQFPLDFNKLMKQCYSDITPAQLQAMSNSTNDDVEYFLAHGHLSEEQLDKSAVPSSDINRSVPRDQGPLNHQRAVLLTHVNTVTRREDYVNSGLPLGNAITDASLPKPDKNQLKKDAKLISSLQKREAKQKEEKERKEKMTEEEKAAEKRTKALASAAKKEKKEAEIQSARARLAKASGMVV